MRLIDADRLLKYKTDHERISTHIIWNAPTVDVVTWKDFRDFLDDNAEDFDCIDKRLDALERKLVEEAERLWKTVVPLLNKQMAKQAVKKIEKEQNDD